MPLDWPVRAVAGRQDFWEHFFWLSSDQLRHLGAEPGASAAGTESFFSEFVNHKGYRSRIDFPVGGRGLRLEFDAAFSRFTLSVLDAAGAPAEIGWDGRDSYYPDVLRWEEIDLIGKSIMIADPTLPHPGLAVLLLLRFAPVGDGDNGVGRIFPMIHDAWRTVGLASMASQEGEPTGLADARGSGFEWVRDEDGWKLDQNDAHRHRAELLSLRHVENRDFPHAEFNALIDDARRLASTLLDPRWVDTNVRELARAIDVGKAFERLPILADALMDAGCDSEPTLAHCRNPMPGQESSWVVDDVLGKPWRITGESG